MNLNFPNLLFALISGPPVTTAWRVLKLRMEEEPPIWGVAANILNNESRTAGVVLGEVLTTPHHKNVYCYEIFIEKASNLD